MNQDEMGLDRLNEIVSVEMVPWFPSTLIAWLIILSIVCATLIFLFAWLRKYRNTAYQREAIRELRSAQSSVEVSVILKRSALQAFPRESVASLTGEKWFDWLQEFAVGSKTVADELAGSSVANSNASQELREFADACVRGMPPINAVRMRD